MRKRLRAAILAGMIALAAGSAYALWIEIQITPKYPTADNRTFHVTCKDAESLKRFEVTVEAAPGKRLSPFLGARLSIANADVFVGTVPVEEKRSGDKVVYWFKISPRFISNSRFELDEGRWIETARAAGDPKVEQMMGGTTYWFWLRDFAEAPRAEH